MKKIFCIFSFLVLISTISKAQGLWKILVSHPDSAIHKYDTTYVDPMLNSWTLRYFLNVKQAEINFAPADSAYNARFRSKDFLRYGFGIGYRWLILNAAYGIDPERAGPNGDKSIRHADLQMNIFGRRFLYDIRAQWYRGMEYKGRRRPDMSLVAFGSSLRYNFKHHKYSFKNTYDQTQWQLKSAGAPIAGINVGYAKMTVDSPLVLSPQATFSNVFHENFNVAAGGGYSYTWVIKKHWFITLTGTLYLDGYFVGSKKNFESDPGLKVVLVPETRFGFGYNSKKYYFGVQSTMHRLPGSISENLSYEYKYNNLKLLFAHRLNFNPFGKTSKRTDE